MREEIEKMVGAGKLQPEHVDPLVEMATSGFCLHKKWGCGKITTIDTVFGRLTIDFPGKPGHSMDMGFAAGLLQPIPADHILARKITDMQGLHQMAALHHLELIKVVLKSFDGEATLDQIQKVIVPDIIADDWKKWWEAARREMKKDGHFKIPLKKAEPIVYQSEEIPLQQRLLADFDKARGLKAKLVVVYEILKSLDDMDDAKAAAVKIIDSLNEDIVSHHKNQTSLALEAVFARDELRSKTKADENPAEIAAKSIWLQIDDLAPILEGLPAAKQRLALASYKDAAPESWAETLLMIINDVPTKLCGECAKILSEAGQFDEVKERFQRLINQHQAGSPMLLWLAKERSDAYADILGPEVFRAMLSAIERDQFNEVRSNKLSDFIMSDQALITDLISSASIDAIKDLTRNLQLSPSFEDMDKRSLLGRIVKQYPVIQSMISGDESRDDNRLVVSWDSLERKRKEYEDLVRKKIPANSKEIAIARSYGDLRENHEYKSAKEMQKLLMKRKAELERDMTRAQGTDFLDVDTSTVNVGCIVDVTDLKNGNKETYSILGAWDLDIDKNIISYLSPFAKAMLGAAKGDEVEFETTTESRKLRIEDIRPARTKPVEESVG